MDKLYMIMENQTSKKLNNFESIFINFSSRSFIKKSHPIFSYKISTTTDWMGLNIGKWCFT